MKYFLIKNARIAGQNEATDILIGNEKIIAIGPDLLRPDTETATLDAHGRYAIPSLVDINSCFNTTDTNDDLANMVFESLSSGVTTWLAGEPTSNIPAKTKYYSEMETGVLNFGFHFLVSSFRFGDMNRIHNMEMPYGITSTLFKLTTPEAIRNDRLELFIETAFKNGLTMLYDIDKNCGAEEHIAALSEFATRISDNGDNAMFLNVRYEEELEIIQKLRSNCNVYAQLCYNPIPQSASVLTELSGERISELLRKNNWCTLGITNTTYSHKINPQHIEAGESFIHRHILPILAAMPTSGEPLSIDELVEFAIVRPIQMLGLSPEREKITVGSDADICIWDDSTQQDTSIRTQLGVTCDIKMKGFVSSVFMNGQLVYDNKMRNDEIKGRHIYRRLLT